MKPISRVQNVYDPQGKPKIAIPKEVARIWNFPKYVYVEYDEKEGVLKVRPYR